MMVQFDVKRVQKGTESFMVSFDFTKTPVTQIADYIIISASKHNSSDIHFDPREDGMMVRFRIDGDCQDYTFVPKAYEKNLTTRLKLLANMNITESRLPQDGAIKGTFGDTYLDMRVSALPLNEGEKIVIRILDYTRSLQGIDTLGFHPKNLEKVKRMMGIPNGIILTTGATGSGKSTTTYSILQELNKPETNIITVEDPIEMNIEGINQVQVNADIGMTFAAALRSILRQDPNIILIGEIRDSETAQIAVRASITGHLVLSTIHTNNALATVERLLDMDVERYLLSTALSGIISQRLAKMLCPDCRYQRETTKYEKKVFKKYMNMDVAMVWDANPKGCDHCRRGYHGRIAVHEVLELTDEIRAAISNEKIEKKDLAKMVYDGGTITMLQDALIKCLEGKTSFEEVYRTIEIENEDDDNYEHEMATEIKDSVPKEVIVAESDDLLDSPVHNNGENDISNMMSAPAFSAADFADNPEGDKKSTEEGQNTETKNQSSPQESSNPENTETTVTASTTAPTQAPEATVPANTAPTIPIQTTVAQPTNPVVPTVIPPVATQPVSPITTATVVSPPVAPPTAIPVSNPAFPTTPMTTTNQSVPAPVTQPTIPVATATATTQSVVPVVNTAPALPAQPVQQVPVQSAASPVVPTTTVASPVPQPVTPVQPTTTVPLPMAPIAPRAVTSNMPLNPSVPVTPVNSLVTTPPTTVPTIPTAGVPVATTPTPMVLPKLDSQ